MQRPPLGTAIRAALFVAACCPLALASNTGSSPTASISRATVADLELPSTRGAAFVVPVHLDGVARTLLLQPHSLRARGFQLLVQDATGLHPVDDGGPATYRGVVEGFPESRVGASLDQEGLHAFVRLNPLDQGYSIEPARPGRNDERVWPHHVAAAGIGFDGARCGVDGGQPSTKRLAPAVPIVPGRRTPSRSDFTAMTSTINICDIACDSDVELYVAKSSSVLLTADFIEGIVNVGGLLYEEELQTNFAITAIIVRTTEPDPYPSGVDLSAVLSYVDDEWAGGHHPTIVRDTVHCFCGRAWGGNIVGLGHVGTLCNTIPDSVSQPLYVLPVPFWKQVALFSHEVGHVFGGCHCDDLTNCAPAYSSDCGIMCSGLGGCSIATRFGGASAAQLAAFIASVSCLGTGSGSIAPTLSQVLPAHVGVFGGTQLTLQGQDLDHATHVTINGTAYDLTHFIVQDSQTITLSAPGATSLGVVGVTVSGPGGASHVQRFRYVETDPPQLLATGGDYVTGLTASWTFGSLVGLQADVERSFDASTTTTNGVTVLTNGSVLQSVTLDAAGLGAYSETLSLSTGTQFWMQVVVRSGSQIVGSTNITSHIIVL